MKIPRWLPDLIMIAGILIGAVGLFGDGYQVGYKQGKDFEAAWCEHLVRDSSLSKVVGYGYTDGDTGEHYGCKIVDAGIECSYPAVDTHRVRSVSIPTVK